MTKKLHWGHERPEWSFSAAIVGKRQGLLFPSFSHPVDPQSNTTEEEKAKKLMLTVREYHTGNIALWKQPRLITNAEITL